MLIMTGCEAQAKFFPLLPNNSHLAGCAVTERLRHLVMLGESPDMTVTDVMVGVVVVMANAVMVMMIFGGICLGIE